MSLEIKQVIDLAREQFKALLPDLGLEVRQLAPKKGMLPPLRISDIRVEELEKEGGNWAVTLSVPNPTFKEGDLLEGIRQARQLARVAKVIVIDSEGKLVALRERAA